MRLPDKHINKTIVMKKQAYFILLFMCLFFVQCSNTKTNQDKHADHNSARDSIDRQMLMEERPEEEDDTPSFDEDRRRYIQSYDKIEKIDTTVKIGSGETLHLYTSYYCLYDSSLIIPRKYVFDDKGKYVGKPFLTHNFKSKIILVYKQDTVFNQDIDKKVFKNYLTPELKKYGIILSPELESINADGIKLGYSISIPVTDLGVYCSVFISKTGLVKVSSD